MNRVSNSPDSLVKTVRLGDDNVNSKKLTRALKNGYLGELVGRKALAFLLSGVEPSEDSKITLKIIDNLVFCEN